MSLFSISVWCKGILGYGGFTPMHIWLLEVARLCRCVLFSWPNLEKLFGLTYIHPYPPTYCSYIRLLPDLPCMEDIMFISEWVWCGIFMQLIPHLVGQLLLLLMQVWWHNLWDVIFIWEPTQLICAEMWIASRCTLNSKTFHWGHTPRPPYKHVLRMQHTRLQIFQYFAWIMYFARPKLKCFSHSWLALLLFQQKFVHVTMRQQQTDSGGNAHIKKLM